jgi:hypothetical protein
VRLFLGVVMVAVIGSLGLFGGRIIPVDTILVDTIEDFLQSQVGHGALLCQD